MMIIFSDTARAQALPHRTVGSWSDFLTLKLEPEGFWIAQTWSGDVGALAQHIRRSRWWDRLSCTEAPSDNPLLDGQSSLPDAGRRILRAELVKAGLKLDFEQLLPAEKLILYMYMRDQYELLAQYQPTAKALYVYPLVEVLGHDADDANWFTSLVRNQLLSPVRLLNRIRTCRQCGSGHLSYVDVCPSCASIEIKSTPLLHCFTCGHVSVKAAFEVSSTLVCPKCEARLRHIGVDYDFPTSQYVCRQCHHGAVEARIVAHCYDCQTKDDPSQLEVSEIYAMTLNSRGIEALRQGQFHDSFSVVQGSNHVMLAYFKQLLLWSVTAQQRYKEMSFSLFLIEFVNTNDLLSHYGSGKVHLMLDEFSDRLRQILRSSDVTSRDTAERLWILFPYTLPDQTLNGLIEKTRQIQPAGQVALTLRLKSFHAARDLDGHIDANAIMNQLVSEQWPCAS